MSDYTPKKWRDEVSGDLGYIKAKLESLHYDISKMNGSVKQNCKRLDALEKIQTERNAVKRWLVGVWALIGGVVAEGLHQLITRI